MGKHHWKVEKQPEWYVKAVRKTIAALPGGYVEAAEWLDVTENALFNRLRADGDQIFPLGWAMILQRAAGTHFIADAVLEISEHRRFFAKSTGTISKVRVISYVAGHTLAVSNGKD